MKLSYRGCQYQKPTASIAARNCSINLKYRGVNYILEQGEPQIISSNYLLKYRGISYQKGLSFPTFHATSDLPFKAVIV